MRQGKIAVVVVLGALVVALGVAIIVGLVGDGDGEEELERVQSGPSDASVCALAAPVLPDSQRALREAAGGMTSALNVDVIKNLRDFATRAHGELPAAGLGAAVDSLFRHITAVVTPAVPHPSLSVLLGDVEAVQRACDEVSVGGRQPEPPAGVTATPS